MTQIVVGRSGTEMLTNEAGEVTRQLLKNFGPTIVMYGIVSDIDKMKQLDCNLRFSCLFHVRVVVNLCDEMYTNLPFVAVVIYKECSRELLGFWKLD